MHWVPLALVLALALALALFGNAEETLPSQHVLSPPRALHNATAVFTDVADEYIVLFTTYDTLAAHTTMLGEAFAALSASQQPSGWDVVPRPASAVRPDVDFAVVRVRTRYGTTAQVMSALPAVCRHIRSVVPQRRVDQSILSMPDELLDDVDDPLGVPGLLRLPTQKQVGSGSSGSGYVPSQALGAKQLWSKGVSGAGVRVAVFDTGLRDGHPHFPGTIEERTNWTDEDMLDDGLGHGSFVAGVIAGRSQCPGFAPDARLLIFRVFTLRQVSYTSWFLEAFNHALFRRVKVLNFSIGGPDFMDRPFTDKVNELSANGIIIVSAIGNDGPLYGTLNNPADMPDVIGVGSYDDDTLGVSYFSSRGMTAWEMPTGYGRMKPDLVAPGKKVMGSRRKTGCRSLSGTSVASPSVAGIVALLASSVPPSQRDQVVNPASMKQLLLASADRLSAPGMFEQGAGRIDLLESYRILSEYTPTATLSPSDLDLADCPYAWPYCTQPAFFSGMPIIINATLLNGMGVYGTVVDKPRWVDGSNGDRLSVSFTWSPLIWPWVGHVAVYVRVRDDWVGTAEGRVEVDVRSPKPGGKRGEFLTSTATLKISVPVIDRPPRAKRILVDHFRNLRFPPGYLPRDQLAAAEDPFDWNGDHIHTNFRGLYTRLRSWGYYVDVLGGSYLCFDAKLYGTLLIIDPEEEFYLQEVDKLEQDVRNGLNLVVIADWYNADILPKLRFLDQNTRRILTPLTGGANLPALNDLLDGFGIAFGSRVVDGNFLIGRHTGEYASGATIVRWPAGRVFFSAHDLKDQGHAMISGRSAPSVPGVAILGMTDTPGLGGRITVFGDSSCLDMAHLPHTPCWSTVQAMLAYAETGEVEESLASTADTLTQPYAADDDFLPVRPENDQLWRYSWVAENSVIRCPASTNSPRTPRWTSPSGRFGTTGSVKPEGDAGDGTSSSSTAAAAGNKDDDDDDQEEQQASVPDVKPPSGWTDPARPSEGYEPGQDQEAASTFVAYYFIMSGVLLILAVPAISRRYRRYRRHVLNRAPKDAHTYL